MTLFVDETTVPNPVTAEIAAIMARLFAAVTNEVAVEGHLSAKSLLQVDNPVWELSTGRAAQMRLMLQSGGLDPMRIMRQTGAGDREPVVRDATAAAQLPEGDGYLAALINFRFIANAVWSTEEAVAQINAAAT